MELPDWWDDVNAIKEGVKARLLELLGSRVDIWDYHSGYPGGVDFLLSPTLFVVPGCRGSSVSSPPSPSEALRSSTIAKLIFREDGVSLRAGGGGSAGLLFRFEFCDRDCFDRLYGIVCDLVREAGL